MGFGDVPTQEDQSPVLVRGQTAVARPSPDLKAVLPFEVERPLRM